MPKAQLEKFSWELDEDDDLATEIELKIENSDGGKLDFVITNCLITMSNGCILSGSEVDEEPLGGEESLEPGDSETIYISTGWMSGAGLLRSESSLNASVGLAYYRYGDPVPLFESEIPPDHETLGFVEEASSPNNLFSVTGAMICRHDADDDDDVRLDAKFGIRNTNPEGALKVLLQMVITDKNGDTIGESDATVDLAPESSYMNDFSAYAHKSKLKGAKLRFSYRTCDLVGRERLDIESS